MVAWIVPWICILLVCSNYPYLYCNLVPGKNRRVVTSLIDLCFVEGLDRQGRLFSESVTRSKTIVVLSSLPESIMTVIEQLKHEAELLPEPLAQEVLDFLLFVRRRHVTVWPPPAFFDHTLGAWKGEPLERSPQGEQEQRLELE